MNKKTLVLSFLVCTLLANGESKGIKLEESVITTENFETTVRDTPANVSIVTGEEIEKSGAKDLVDALRNVPGVRVTRYAGTIKFDIRGLNSMYSDRNALLTLDGVPASSSQIANLPMNMISRIEVVPGGGNILYGDKAIGGVVNILTKNAKDEKNYGSIFTEAGSFSKNKFGMNYGTKLTDNLLFDMGYIKSDDGGWRHGEDFDNDSLNLKAKYLLKNGDMEYKYTLTEDKNLAGVAIPRPVIDKDREDPGKIAGSKYKSQDHYLKYRKEITSDTEVLIYGNYYEKNNKTYSRYKNDNYNGKFNRNEDEVRKYVKAQIKHKYLENNYLILGTDYLNEENKPYSIGGSYKEVTGFDNDGKSVIKKDKYVESGDSVKKNIGVFAMNKISKDKLQLTQGIRYDRADYDFYWRNGKLNNWYKIGTKDSAEYDNFSYELSGNYLYSETGSVYVSYNRGFRTPTVGEMKYTQNSEKLKPQTQDSVEVGMKDFLGNTFFSMSTFYKRTTDEIYSAIPPEFTGMVNYNIGTTERVGFEAYGEQYIDKLTLRSSITYIKAKVIDGEYSGSEIPSVPNWKLTAGLKYDFTENLAMSTDVLYYSESYDLDDLKNERSKDTGEYITVDISANYQMSPNLLLTARIENIFDEEYDEYAGYWSDQRQYYPAIGRTFTVGATYTF